MASIQFLEVGKNLLAAIIEAFSGLCTFPTADIPKNSHQCIDMHTMPPIVFPASDESKLQEELVDKGHELDQEVEPDPEESDKSKGKRKRNSFSDPNNRNKWIATGTSSLSKAIITKSLIRSA